MPRSILPNGEELHETPAEVLRYLNPDGLRQLLRQERLRWNLKVNKDTDYIDKSRMFKYASEIHNEGQYQRMEIQTLSDNGAYAGYAGINIDSGVFGLPHKIELWDHSMTKQSRNAVINRTLIGASAQVPGMRGHGLNEVDKMVADSENRMASILFDPFDGRAYLYSNDDVEYYNNDRRPDELKLPLRTVARIADIPTRITDLVNDSDTITDPDYKHTDNNFTNSNRFIIDNIDDRTFVYPEIAKDKDGNYISNMRMGLNGKVGYDESDGLASTNSQPDLRYEKELPGSGDREGAAINRYNANLNFSGVYHAQGFLPGIFKSLEELEKVDLLRQKQLPRTHSDSPGAKRSTNYYILDGRWSSNWFDRINYKESYLAQPLVPSNMEVHLPGTEPIPFSELSTGVSKFKNDDLYQWRYNRIDVTYKSEDVRMTIVEAGEGYQENDILTWVFGNDVFHFKVTKVGAIGQIQEGHFMPTEGLEYDQDPSTHGVGVEFMDSNGTGYGAMIAIEVEPTISSYATQLKNNLYAYVDITPTVSSDNSSPWSDIRLPDTQGGRVGIRSTAAGPAYSGVNSGRGGLAPNDDISPSPLYEHGGNATAGVHVHLFRYVINTANPRWEIVDDVQVFTGEWVDAGPMGLERPCDIKALLFSNYDCNNFNNMYKWQMDMMTDTAHRNPDAVVTANSNALSPMYFHIDQKDPTEDRRFTMEEVDPTTSKIVSRDVTNQVVYINAATGVMFIKNQDYKTDEDHYGYGDRAPGWIAIAGAVSR